MELNNIPDDIIRIMRDQKEQDDQLPLGQRLGIGGEIHLAVITQNQVNIFNIHTFEDYDSCFHQMCERLLRFPDQSGPPFRSKLGQVSGLNWASITEQSGPPLKPVIK